MFDRLAAPRTLLQSRLFVMATALVFAVLVPWAQVPLLPLALFLPLYQSAVLITAVLTAAILFGWFRRLRTRALWWMATAYLLTGVLTLLALGTRTEWLDVAWHAGFPLLLIFSSVRGRPLSRVLVPILGSFVLVGALASLIVLLTLARVRVIENLMSAALALGAAATAVVGLKRPPTVLGRWLGAALAAWTVETALSIFSAGPYDLGFYSGRVFGLVSNSIVLVVLLRENRARSPQPEQASQPLRESSLDAVGGLARVAGNRELYRKLLAYFAAHWPETAATLKAALSAGDRGELARVAHTVKGSAGNLGITGVAEAAEALDSALAQSANLEVVAVLVRRLEAAGTAVLGLLPKDVGDLEV